MCLYGEYRKEVIVLSEWNILVTRSVILIFAMALLCDLRQELGFGGNKLIFYIPYWYKADVDLNSFVTRGIQYTFGKCMGKYFIFNN